MTLPPGMLPRTAACPGSTSPAHLNSSPISSSSTNVTGIDEVGTNLQSQIDFLFANDLSPTGTTSLDTGRNFPTSDESRLGSQFRDLASGDVVAAVPEPSTYALMISGLLLLAWKHRHRSPNPGTPAPQRTSESTPGGPRASAAAGSWRPSSLRTLARQRPHRVFCVRVLLRVTFV